MCSWRLRVEIVDWRWNIQFSDDWQTMSCCFQGHKFFFSFMSRISHWTWTSLQKEQLDCSHTSLVQFATSFGVKTFPVVRKDLSHSYRDGVTLHLCRQHWIVSKKHTFINIQGERPHITAHITRWSLGSAVQIQHWQFGIKYITITKHNLPGWCLINNLHRAAWKHAGEHEKASSSNTEQTVPGGKLWALWEWEWLRQQLRATEEEKQGRRKERKAEKLRRGFSVVSCLGVRRTTRNKFSSCDHRTG